MKLEHRALFVCFLCNPTLAQPWFMWRPSVEAEEEKPAPILLIHPAHQCQSDCFATLRASHFILSDERPLAGGWADEARAQIARVQRQSIGHPAAHIFHFSSSAMAYK